MSETCIQLKSVSKMYGNTKVISDLNLSVKKGERLILLGPSGCGKSTTLRMIAGLETVSSGDLMIDGHRMNDVPAGKRHISMVFQDYALYPHMTIEKNIAYGLMVNKVNKEEVARRVDQVLSILNLKGLERRYPRDLSGGQRQRVALARSIAKQSTIFLLDEPLSNLDAQMRVSARNELLKIHETYHQTFVYVTHDQMEAMTLGHRIALMRDGQLQMLATPYQIYHRPANVFVAKFIGTPATNIVHIHLDGDHFHFQNHSLTAGKEWLPLIAANGSNEFLLGIRPEHMQLSKINKPGALSGTVKRVEEYGSRTGVIFNFEESEMIAISDSRNWRNGERIYFTFNQKAMYLFDKDTEKTIGFVD
ncbi:ABC transporter ATP-binding protein [Sporolactobacillus shoreicorticis]|uniref:ABC transporter ATP-binding protein n=1 Tax=Sporolactobacillus shoreicorticis TaxID=1923877 RepID=A0ABW5S722_9BACL|nr:ABC transporter ATP-binding protein [Sporolactobacillus shoreicorticis]MCO7125491.1 ABC transporter ATP-binding protein [Sporolactobacillus shoreicorticis]